MGADLAALTIDDLVDRQAAAYRLLGDVQGELARRAAQQPAQATRKPDRTLDPDEAAVVVGVSRKALLAGARAGTIPSTKLGRRTVRFSERALRRWLDARSR